MSVLLPEVQAYVEQSGGARSPVWRYLAALDQYPQNAAASNGLRVAVLFAPLYRARLATLAGARVQEQGYDVAREILNPLVQRMTLPRQTFYTACMLLDGLHRFEEGTHHSRRIRMARHALFQEALALRRMELIATEQGTDSLREWEELATQASPAGRHAPRTGDEQDHADAPASQPRQRGDAPSVEAQADADQVPRRRRRPRRRGGRRGSPRGDTATHLPGIPPGDSNRVADAG